MWYGCVRVCVISILGFQLFEPKRIIFHQAFNDDTLLVTIFGYRGGREMPEYPLADGLIIHKIGDVQVFFFLFCFSKSGRRDVFKSEPSHIVSVASRRRI